MLMCPFRCAAWIAWLPSNVDDDDDDAAPAAGPPAVGGCGAKLMAVEGMDGTSIGYGTQLLHRP